MHYQWSVLGLVAGLTACAGLFSVTSGCASAGDGANVGRPETDDGIAVVELFTSEGCSSCPPADAVLGRIAKESADRPVFAMAWHVDYWDRLGWADPFSSAQATARQRAYARSFKADSVYTPQMIVNGVSEFNGASGDTADRNIKTALAAQSLITLDLSAGKAVKDKIDVDYTLSSGAKADGAKKSDLANCVINVVLLQNSATVRVARGENGGRTLRHDNIVRAWQQLPLKSSKTSTDGDKSAASSVTDFAGKTTLTLPAGLSSDEVTIVAFVQNPETMTIQTAARTTPSK